MSTSDPPTEKSYFAPPSLEGARLALRPLLQKGEPRVDAKPLCAVAIDVFTEGGVLVQRALAHADVEPKVRDALRELVDRHVTRFAEAQRLDAPGIAWQRGGGDPYRGSAVVSNDFAGFDCGHALAVSKARVARLRAGLRNADDLDVHLYAVPFLLARIARGRSHEARQEVVILRRDDGAYVYEPVPEPGAAD